MARNADRISRASLISAALLLVWSVPCLALTEPRPSEVRRWADAQAVHHDALREKLREIDDGYEVLFIPGFMGSRLEFPGFTYGVDAIQPDSLMGNRSPNKVGILLDFNAGGRIRGVPVFRTKEQVYGPGVKLLEAAVGGRPAYDFAYDWRQDLALSAEKLQEYAVKNLRGKRVVIVAHSMGGVLAWHWKNLHVEDRPFSLIALVLLGSPLDGSCEPADMLIEGYRPSGDPNWFMEVAYRLVFGEAHPAVFTFPSVFELLARDGSCLRLLAGDRAYPQNHFDAGFWQKQMAETLKGYAEKAGMRGKEPEYLALVAAAIDTARRFNARLDLKEHRDLVYYLYSEDRPMPAWYTVRADSGTLAVVKTDKPDAYGDGRVPAASATNDRFRVPGQGRTWPLREEHGNLLADPRFGHFVQKELKPLVELEKSREIIRFAANDGKLRDKIVAMEWVVPPGGRPDAIKESLAKSETEIARLNLETAAKAASAARPGVKNLGRALEEDQPGVAAALYKSAWLVNPDEMDARTLNRLGRIKLQQGRVDEAAAILERAAEIAETGKDPHLDRELKGYIYSNLGAAYEKANFPQKALAAYTKAAELDNAAAAKNLRALKSRLGQAKKSR